MGLLNVLHSRQSCRGFSEKIKKYLKQDEEDCEACAAYKTVYQLISEAIENGDADFFRKIADVFDSVKKRIVAVQENSAEKELCEVYYCFYAIYGRVPTHKEAKRIAIDKMIKQKIGCTKEWSNYQDKKAAVEESFNWGRAFNRLIKFYPSEKVGKKRVRTSSKNLIIIFLS
jgi:3-oxoacyl-ACP reductase-like protein